MNRNSRSKVQRSQPDLDCLMGTVASIMPLHLQAYFQHSARLTQLWGYEAHIAARRQGDAKYLRQNGDLIREAFKRRLGWRIKVIEIVVE